MATVIFYNLILFSSTFFVWLSEKGKRNSDRIFLLSIAFLIVFVPSALRYDIGTDYVNYIDIYKNLDDWQHMEKGFYFVNWILKSLDANQQWIIIILAFLFLIIAFKSYPKKDIWLFHLVFILILWFSSFNIVRQAVTLSFNMLAIVYFFNKEYRKFVIFILMSSLFHLSGIFMLFISIISLIPFSKLFKEKVFPILFIISIIFIWMQPYFIIDIIEQVLNIVGIKYASYFSNSRHFIETNFGSGLGVLVKVMFCLYIIIMSKKILKFNVNYWLLIILNFCYAIALILGSNIVIFGRLGDVFLMTPIFSIYVLYQVRENKIINRAVLGIFCIFLILSFIKESFGEVTSYADPKRNPYKTILTE